MGLSLNERQRRISRIQEQMGKDNIDSLIVCGRGDYQSRGNIRYVTGYGVITGEQLCVVPRRGDPIFIARSTPFLSILRNSGWITETRETANPIDQARLELSQLDEGNLVGIVGMGDISVPLYLVLQKLFGGRLIDSTALFEQVRMVKSEEEIQRMQASASIADEIYWMLKDTIRPGLSDHEIYGEIKRIIHQRGCEYSMELIGMDRSKMNLFHSVGKKLEADSILAMEITPSSEGYYAQLPISMPVGHYPSFLEKAISVWEEAMSAALSILRPGTRVCDIFRALLDPIERKGYLSPWRPGHAIGLDVIDFWSVTETNKRILEPGMTLVLHPCVLVEPDGSGIGMGYTYLVTENGNQRLSKVDLVD